MPNFTKASQFYDKNFFITEKNIFLYTGIFFWGLILVLNVFGVLPEIEFNFFLFFLSFFIFICLIVFFEKYKKNISEKNLLRLFYIFFIVLISFINVTGGIKSNLKWLIPLFIILISLEKLFWHSLLLTAFSFLGLIKKINLFTVDDYLIFVFLLIFTGIIYFKDFLKEEEKKLDLQETKKEIDFNEFRTITLNQITKFIGLYHSIIKPASILFFVKNHKKEGVFNLIAFVSKYEGDINTDFKIDLNEGLLGAAIKKSEFLIIDVQHIQIPYYSKIPNIKKMATKTVVFNKVIGVIVIDFDSDIILSVDDLKGKLNKLADDLLNVLNLIDMGNQLILREKRISKLYEINEKLNILEGKNKVMQSFFEEIKSYNIISGYIAEFKAEEDAFEVTESFGYPENLKSNKIPVNDDEILKYVFETEKKLVIEDAISKNIKLNFGKPDIDSFFICLLKRKNSIYGFIKLDKIKGSKFSDFEIKTLEIIVSSLTIIFENAELYEKIIKQATRDGLTGLLNHITFQEKLRNSIEKCDSREYPCLSLLIADIDNFKKFNDTFGHQEGDRVLKKVAMIFKEFEKKYENTYAARYGGEEFVFVMENCDIFKAVKIAEEIRSFCEKNLEVGNEKEKRKITLSIGVSNYPDYAKTIRDLIKNADEYLYVAKKEGKNRVKSILDEKMI